VKLAERVAIITGGGHGIGRAIALRFAAEGCAITIAGTGRERLEATARELREHGARAQVSLTDVADEPAVERMVARAASEFGRLDIWSTTPASPGPPPRPWTSPSRNGTGLWRST